MGERVAALAAVEQWRTAIWMTRFDAQQRIVAASRATRSM